MDASNVVAGHRVIPVVVVDDRRKALRLGELFLEAGMNRIEVTLRTANALGCIEAMVEEFPDAKMGAGSVVTPDQLRAAENAGAEFVVSPGASDELIAAADSTHWVPGAATASEIMKLRGAGYRTVKFFPAELLGGVNAIRALSEPITGIQFFPTGGISESNLPEYLGLERVACVGGSWLAPKSDIENGRWSDIQARCKSLQRTLTLI